MAKMKEISSDYRPGKFIDVSCSSATIHSYGDMYSKLEELSERYPDDVILFKVGESEGYGGSDNSRVIPGIHITATEESERTVFIVAGHHPEYSGPEAAYLIAERILESYEANNPNVREMRKNTNITIIPQVNVDLYDNLEKFEADRDRYWQEGFGLKDSTEPPGYNYYGPADEYEAWYLRGPMMESLAVKGTIRKTIKAYKNPFLSIDLHEHPWADNSFVSQIESTDSYETHVVHPDYIKQQMALVGSGKMKDKSRDIKARTDTFFEYMADMGAQSFLFEIQGDLSLDEKIQKILVGVDCIFARYFL